MVRGRVVCLSWPECGLCKSRRARLDPAGRVPHLAGGLAAVPAFLQLAAVRAARVSPRAPSRHIAAEPVPPDRPAALVPDETPA